MRTLVLGDSHVFWLERFHKEQRLVIPNLCMRAEDHVGMLGIRGGTVPSLKSAMTVKFIKTFAPELVILHVGGNDLDSKSRPPPQLVGMRIFECAKQIISLGVSRVVVCQIVRREKWRQFSYEAGTMAVTDANEFMQAACGGHATISFWKHKGLWSSERAAFRLDGVHFNNLGNYKLLRSIRGAIITASKSVQNLPQSRDTLTKVYMQHRPQHLNYNYWAR